ncbi:hypothetical protein GE21DRAFT_1306045 [Neurospora crassa]|nr:hypothetical protein GE21DRAFT_1306045 [Neurospora crassa]
MTGCWSVNGSLDFFNRWPSSLVTSGVKIGGFRPGRLQLTGSHSSCPVDLPSSDLCGHCMGRSCRRGRLLTFEWAVRTSKKRRIRLSVQPKRREKRCGSNTGRLTRRPDLGVKVLANRKSSSLLMVVIDGSKWCVRNAALMSDLISWIPLLSHLLFCTVSCSGCRPIARQGAQQMSLSPLGTGSTISLQNAVVLNVDHQGPQSIVSMVSVGSRLDNVMYQARSD